MRRRRGRLLGSEAQSAMPSALAGMSRSPGSRPLAVRDRAGVLVQALDFAVLVPHRVCAGCPRIVWCRLRRTAGRRFGGRRGRGRGFGSRRRRPGRGGSLRSGRLGRRGCGRRLSPGGFRNVEVRSWIGGSRLSGGFLVVAAWLPQQNVVDFA